VLFVAATFLAWYFTWFGRGLSDADISDYLSDTKNPRHVQHALLQVQQRIERGDSSARSWYPQVEALSNSTETEYRLTTAWLMGFDNQSDQFHAALLRWFETVNQLSVEMQRSLWSDSTTRTGHDELVAVLKPYPVESNATGVVSSTLHVGSDVSRGALLARIQQTDGKVSELRSPLPGRIEVISKANGSQVTTGQIILNLNSDEQSVFEALRGLSLIGTRDDLPIIQSFANSSTATERVKEQANLTVSAIQSRSR
jgi:biotin carboxyl carrier protein